MKQLPHTNWEYIQSYKKAAEERAAKHPPRPVTLEEARKQYEMLHSGKKSDVK